MNRLKHSWQEWGRRRVRWLALPAAGLLVAAAFTFAPLDASIVNSKHDFSSLGTGGLWGSATTDQVCIFCHTPHNAQAGQEPLWNRLDQGYTYATYGSSTLDSSPTQPGGNSLLCLSCHDGSVAIDAYVAGSTGAPQMMALGDVYYPGSPYGEGGPNIGGNYTGNAGVNDLSNDHPISITYDAALVAADGQLVDPTLINMPLYESKLECATCHDVHNQNVVAGTKLLRVSKAGSAICLRCHAK